MIRGLALFGVLAVVSTFGLMPFGVSLAQTEPDPVIAIVNGEEILNSDLVMFHASLPEQYRQISLEILHDQLLEGLIETRLLAQAAVEAGMMDDPEVKRRLAYVAKDALQQSYLDQMLAAEITEERQRAAYQATIGDTPGVEEINARHILLEDEAAGRAVITELDGGADFAILAKERSTGPSAPGGGDLGFFTKEQMVVPFAEAAFAMAPGEYSKEPVKTQFGWHVIKVVDRRIPPPPTFEQSQAEISQRLAKDFVFDLMVKLNEKAEISRFDLQGNEIEAPSAPAN
jgi:peptidyl-prolyl cis-trans isomerase C